MFQIVAHEAEGRGPIGTWGKRFPFGSLPLAENDLVLLCLAFGDDSGSERGILIFDNVLQVLMGHDRVQLLDMSDALDKAAFVQRAALGQCLVPFSSRVHLFFVNEEVRN